MTAPLFTARPKADWALKALSAFGFLCVALGLTFGDVRSARAAEDPSAFILSLTDRVVGIVSDGSLNDKTRLDKFRELITANTRLDRAASFVIGRYAGVLRAEHKYDQYSELFNEYVVRIYAARLGAYNGQKVVIDKVVPKGTSETLVYSTVMPGREGGNPIPVIWRLVQDGDSYKILDVGVFNAWMSIEQRDSFSSVISNNGGKPDAIITHLQQQLAKSTPDDPGFKNGSPT